MDAAALIALAVALAMDAAAVSLAIASVRTTLGALDFARVAGAFGLFQGAMAAIGWSAGTGVQGLIAAIDHWIAFAVLVGIGVHMLTGASRGRPAFRSDPTRGVFLLGLAVATSIDALAAGFSLAMIRVSIWGPVLSIALITAALSVGALAIGRRAGRTVGRWAERIGGILLCLVGLEILWKHIAGGA